MDWTVKERCVLCNRGGNLLICNDDGCPISVHKDCMGCKPWFDDMGKFYCPYCHYRRLTAEICQLRDKAILAKKALSAFLNEEMRDGNHRERKIETANEKEQILSMDKTCLENKNDLVSEDVQNQSIHLEEHQQSKPPLPCEEISGLYSGNPCRIMVVYEAHSKPGVACGDEMISDPLESENQKESTECKVADDPQCATRIEKEPQPNTAVVSSSIKKQNHSEPFNKNGKRKKEECMKEHASKAFVSNLDTCISSKQQKRSIRRPTHVLDPPNGSVEAATGAVSCTGISNTGNAGKLNDSSMHLAVFDRNAKLPLLNGKRRVRWSCEEEDMLMIGVQKFSLKVQKNLPWKKILEFGRHVFDASRTPSDLKDKWRRMAT